MALLRGNVFKTTFLPLLSLKALALLLDVIDTKQSEYESDFVFNNHLLILIPDQKISRILVVDDLEDNVFLLTMIPESEGYQVETATSGKEALALIEASSPDLVLLDVMMPDMTSFQVVEKIRKNPRFATLPILLLTAYTDLDFARGLTLGANGFFSKPIDVDTLLKQVGALTCE